MDIKFVEGDPVIIVTFSCQQIDCARDKFGNVVEGHATAVQRVFYLWALQQDDQGNSLLGLKSTFPEDYARSLKLIRR